MHYMVINELLTGRWHLYNRVATITYKSLSVALPTYLHLLLQQYQPTRSLRSGSQKLLALPTFSSEFGRRFQLLCTICLEQVTAIHPISQQFQLVHISSKNPSLWSSLMSTVLLPPSDCLHLKLKNRVWLLCALSSVHIYVCLSVCRSRDLCLCTYVVMTWRWSYNKRRTWMPPPLLLVTLLVATWHHHHKCQCAVVRPRLARPPPPPSTNPTKSPITWVTLRTLSLMLPILYFMWCLRVLRGWLIHSYLAEFCTHNVFLFLFVFKWTGVSLPTVCI